MGVIEPHTAFSLGERLAKLKLRVVGQKRTGQHGRAQSAFAFDDHAGRGAHHTVRGFVEDAPACGCDLRHFHGFIHFREEHTSPRVGRVNVKPLPRKQSGIAVARVCIGFVPRAAPGDGHADALIAQPAHAFEGFLKAARAALGVVLGRVVMVQRNA